MDVDQRRPGHGQGDFRVCQRWQATISMAPWFWRRFPVPVMSVTPGLLKPNLHVSLHVWNIVQVDLDLHLDIDIDI